MRLGKHKNLGIRVHCQVRLAQSIRGQSRVLSGGEQAAPPCPTQSHTTRLITSRAPCLQRRSESLQPGCRRGHKDGSMPVFLNAPQHSDKRAIFRVCRPKNNTLLQATTVHHPFPLSMQMPGRFREILRSSNWCPTVAALIAEVKCKIICIYYATYCYLHLQSRLKLLNCSAMLSTSSSIRGPNIIGIYRSGYNNWSAVQY
jgi:hypothetical protein